MVTVRDKSDAQPTTKKQYRHNARFFARALWSDFYYADLTRDWFRMGHNLKSVSAVNLLLDINPKRRAGDDNYVFAEAGTPIWDLRGSIKTLIEGDRRSGASGLFEGSGLLNQSYSELITQLTTASNLCQDFANLSTSNADAVEKLKQDIDRIGAEIDDSFGNISTRRQNVKDLILKVHNNTQHIQEKREKILEEVEIGNANKQGGTKIARLAAHDMGGSFSQISNNIQSSLEQTKRHEHTTQRIQREAQNLISGIKNATNNAQARAKITAEGLNDLIADLKRNRTQLCTFSQVEPDRFAQDLVNNLDQTEDTVTSYIYLTQYRRLLPIGTQLFTEMPAGIVERRLTKADEEKYQQLEQAGAVVPLHKHFQIGEDTTTRYPLIKEVLRWWPGRPRSTSVKPDEQKWIEQVWGKQEGKVKRTPSEDEIVKVVLEKLISLVPNYGHDQGLEALIWLGLNYSNVKPQEQPKDKPGKGAKRLIGDRGGGIPNGITQALSDYDTKLVQAGKKPLFGPDFINRVTFITSQQESTFANNLRFGRSLASQDRWYFRMPQDLINELTRRSDSSHGGAWNWVIMKRLSRWLWPVTTLARTVAAQPGIAT
ncbi:MAG: hypothetical protein L6Q57_10155, partial [Alphaproteobacteria bacterium]|nr:hypothetical protein [Alphaproteobacteria bacterium]